METILKQELNIDKTNWKLVKFGDVAFEPKETMKDIVSDCIENVVGLEHITSGDIHLRNSASIDESTTFTKKFAKGDVLFGRRRAYLKKAAVAHFDGICSGDITVFRAKSNLLPELLPFIVNNDKFFDYAIQHSAGGLSPRVKFKDLANYEFLLPPKDQQAQLAELLWAMDSLINSETFLLEKLSNTIHSIIENINEEKSFTRIQIKKVLKKEKIIKSDIGISPYLEIGDINIKNKTIDFKEKESVSGSIIAQNKSILISKVRPNRGAITLLKNSYSVSNGFAVLNSNEEIILSEFLFHLLAWNNKFLYQMSRLATGSTYPTINEDDITNYHINIPLDKVIQKNTLLKLDKIYINILEIENKIQSSQSLQKSLINQVF